MPQRNCELLRSLNSTHERIFLPGAFLYSIFANTVVRLDQLCAAILWRNGRVEFSFLVCTPLPSRILTVTYESGILPEENGLGCFSRVNAKGEAALRETFSGPSFYGRDYLQNSLLSIL
jgi:hypothetical protein